MSTVNELYNFLVDISDRLHQEKLDFHACCVYPDGSIHAEDRKFLDEIQSYIDRAEELKKFMRNQVL